MKLLKYLVYFLIIVAVGGCVALKVFSESEPIGKQGSEADALAHEVLAVLNKPAFDTIPYLQWEFFRPGQKYLWDKKNNKAIIQWGKKKVIMDLDNQTATSYKDGVQQSGDKHEKLKAKAWSLWCNDSFWLIAPFKLFDPGTTRELVTLEDGRTGLKIEYTGGGVTPGDKYLWELDAQKRPTGWKMWTKILPVQGLYSAWEGWETFQGAQLSTKHTLAGKSVEMKNVKAGIHWSDFGYEQDPFTI